MSYCRLDPATCVVSCSQQRQTGADVWVPNAPPLQGMHVEQFAKFYGAGYIAIPPHCRTGGGTGGGKGPVTGPGDDDPPASCNPVVPVPILPPGDDYPPTKVLGGGGGGHPGQRGTVAHWHEPLVGKLVWVPTVDSMTQENANYTRAPMHRFDDKGSLVVTRWGTGDGDLVVMPPELGPQHVYGHKGAGGNNGDAQFPPSLSQTGILLFSAEGESGDDSATATLKFGKRVAGTNRPGIGFVFEHSPSTTMMTMQATDSAGALSKLGIINLASQVALGIPTAHTMTGDENNSANFANGVWTLADTNGAERAITGILAPASNRSRLLVITNVGADGLLIANQSGSSDAENRIITATGADVTFAQNETFFLLYDTLNSRWRIV